MSRKEDYFDNSPMENFFGLLKQETYHDITYSNFKQLKNGLTIITTIESRQNSGAVLFNFVNISSYKNTNQISIVDIRSNFWVSLH